MSHIDPPRFLEWVLREVGTCALVLLAHPVRALAQAPASAPDRVRLDYVRAHGAETCPDESFFHDIVAARLGGVDPFVSAAPRRVVLTLLRQGPAFFVAKSVVYEPDGKRLGFRDLTAPDCTDLAESAALAISIWLRPLVATEPSKRPVAAPPIPSPALVRAPDTDVRTLTPASPRRPAVVLEAGPSASFTMLPGVAALGGSVAVGVRWPMFSLGLEGTGEWPTSNLRPTGAALRISAFSGALAPCIHAQWFVGCTLIVAGATVAEAAGAQPANRASPYAAGGLRVGLEIPISSRTSVRVAGDVLANVVRPSATIQNPIVASMPPVAVWSLPIASEELGARVVASF